MKDEITLDVAATKRHIENHNSLADELPKEQARVRALIPIYRDVGPAGKFALSMIEASLNEADKAAASGDVVAMLRAVADLKGYKT